MRDDQDAERAMNAPRQSAACLAENIGEISRVP
jgi:hypothetical protein